MMLGSKQAEHNYGHIVLYHITGKYVKLTQNIVYLFLEGAYFITPHPPPPPHPKKSAPESCCIYPFIVYSTYMPPLTVNTVDTLEATSVCNGAIAYCYGHLSYF